MIKIKFVDFWPNFNVNDNFFIEIIKDKYEIEFSDNPEFLFYSVYGKSHLKYDCIKIFYTGENIIPDFNYCDYAFGYHHINFENRYFRLPLYLLYKDIIDLVNFKHLIDSNEIIQKNRFCNFIYSNSNGKLRNEFFDKLNQYKFIDSGGRFKNNLGHLIDNKIEFQKKFKFSIAFENSYGLGYTTEKIIDAFAAKTIPIYWGNPLVHRDFNTNAFINVHDYSSLDEVVNEIIRIDQDDEIWMKYLSEPAFKEIQQSGFLNLKGFFDEIFTNSKEIKLNRGYYGIWHENHIADLRTSSYLRSSKIFKPIRLIRNVINKVRKK